MKRPKMTCDIICGFFQGLTLYPFPVVIAEPFAGWTPQKLDGWYFGVLTVTVLLPLGAIGGFVFLTFKD